MGDYEKGDIYRAEIKKIAPDTNDITLEGEPVPIDRILLMDFIIAKDETTAGKTMKIGYKKGGEVFYLVEEPATTNYHSVVFDSGLVLVDNEAPIITIESPTAADVCKLFASGRYLK